MWHGLRSLYNLCVYIFSSKIGIDFFVVFLFIYLTVFIVLIKCYKVVWLVVMLRKDTSRSWRQMKIMMH
jgi:hypothetical protein